MLGTNLSFMEVAAITLLAIITVSTILKEIDFFKIKFCYFPIFERFIPNWSFFAPIPNMFDYYLLERVAIEEDLFQEWRLVHPTQDRSLVSFLWHPNKRFSKSFLDLTQALLRYSNDVRNDHQIRLSLPYLHILNYVNACQKDPSIQFIQFMILSHSKLEGYQIVFTSDSHHLRRK